MKKLKIIVIFLIIALNLLQTVKSQSSGSSLLWEISGNGLTKPSYIYGTIHMLPREKFYLSDAVKEKFGSAEKIVLEIDTDNPSMMTEVQAAMLMKDTLIDILLSKEDLLKTSKFFSDSLGMPLSMLNKVKPLLLAAFIFQKFVGANPASYENTFTEMAKSEGKELIGLETVKEQMSYIDKIPLAGQAKLLVESINDYEEDKQLYKQLFETYLTNNIHKVYELMQQSMKEYNEFGDYLINERNNNWIPRIEKLAKENSCFVAVGSGHLGGERGVLALLRSKGYEVKAVQ